MNAFKAVISFRRSIFWIYRLSLSKRCTEDDGDGKTGKVCSCDNQMDTEFEHYFNYSTQRASSVRIELNSRLL